MSRFGRLAVVLGSVLVPPLLLPSVASAQASIAGVAKDTSGAVLPGVTVEAASPALIERVRTVVTDGTGQYRIEALRPGVYTVTFTLAGFNTLKREGIELTGTFTATVNVELRVGALEETVTVTGETPIVDVQGTTRQQVLEHAVIDAIPAGRGATGVVSLGLLTPSVSQGSSGAVQDVGGTSGITLSRMSAHGGDGADQLTLQNGVSVGGINDTGWFNRLGINFSATKETVIDTAAVNAETARGGVRVNVVPKDGGNVFEGTFYGSFANGRMQSTNLTQALKDRGLPTPNRLKKVWDMNPGVGGAIRKDKLWFYLSGMYNGNAAYTAGMFHSLNFNNPNAWTYEPDRSRPAASDEKWRDGQVRLTWQATAKHKLGLVWHEQVNCECPPPGNGSTAPEAEIQNRYPLLRQVQADWTAPLTTRVLVEAGALRFLAVSPNDPFPGLSPEMIAVTEQSTGLKYRSAGSGSYRPNQGLHSRGAVSLYVLSGHAIKVGFNHTRGWASQTDYSVSTLPIAYRFNNGVPNQITESAFPTFWQTNVAHDMGAFVQDKWTVRRLTASYGLRFDWFETTYPEQHLGPTVLAPTRNITFPRQDGVSFKDLTPKLGAAYDVFGNGKTALKATLNKYLQGLASIGIAGMRNPANLLVNSTSRSWNDANRDFVPDCNLSNPTSNGECGAMANSSFGSTQAGSILDPDIVAGWGKRHYNWEFSTGVQHEILPRVTLDVSYFRRWFGNFAAIDNTLVAPSDYTQFSITAPRDPRLPGGGGYPVSGLYDLNPNKVGQVNYFVTSADVYGKMIRHWNGVDISVSARPRNGLLVQGGTSTGREIRDFCDVVAKLPEVLFAAPSFGGPRIGGPATVGYTAGTPAQYCYQSTGLVTQAKLLSSYTIPKFDVLLSATFQSIPGPPILAQYVATNAVVAPSLGRNLSGNAANVTVGLVSPGSMYGERMNQLDLRVGKLLRAARLRTTVNFDLYNALNASSVLTLNNNFASWQVPQVILAARLFKIGVQLDF